MKIEDWKAHHGFCELNYHGDDKITIKGNGVMGHNISVNEFVNQYATDIYSYDVHNNGKNTKGVFIVDHNSDRTICISNGYYDGHAWFIYYVIDYLGEYHEGVHIYDQNMQNSNNPYTCFAYSEHTYIDNNNYSSFIDIGHYFTEDNNTSVDIYDYCGI